MDEIVRQAMAKWPNVPDCFGWLALDRRGQWRMRNEFAQANKLSGDPIRHAPLIDFIVRNYTHDEAGRWFFQNGPQRVFVELDYTPWIVRLSADGAVPTFTTTTAAAFTPTGCFADEGGNVLLSGRVAGHDAEDTIALLHDHDLEPFSSLAQWHGDACGAALGTLAINHATFDIEPIHSADVARRYGFVQHPAG
ncbi:DUF2946 family protein [Ralstonia mannitolilytica]|uniref:DUF2946 family protein n=1 Tax=Ralstonia mannitolilytica TaxID=105219 RepID=UPI000CEE0245|nr:DUF2946 family protein [Ralstonia mannitolilytica]MBU9578424.1 DUF2946 family protein [Ralstonia mannitolilytica]